MRRIQNGKPKKGHLEFRKQSNGAESPFRDPGPIVNDR